MVVKDTTTGCSVSTFFLNLSKFLYLLFFHRICSFLVTYMFFGHSSAYNFSFSNGCKQRETIVHFVRISIANE